MQVLLRKPSVAINYWASANGIGLQETRISVSCVVWMGDPFGSPSRVERGWNSNTLRNKLPKSKGWPRISVNP